MHPPGMLLGLSYIQELLAQIRQTKCAEEARCWWLHSTREEHSLCGSSHGTHLSAEQLVKVVRRLQKAIFDKIFDMDGAFDDSYNCRVPWRASKSIVDDSENRNVTYSFLSDFQNYPLVDECLEIVSARILKMCDSNLHNSLHSFAPVVRDRITKCSCKLFSLLIIIGGCPRKERKSAFMKVRNTKEERRSIFLFDSKLMMIPGYMKSDWTGSEKCFVARFANE